METTAWSPSCLWPTWPINSSPTHQVHTHIHSLFQCVVRVSQHDYFRTNECDPSATPCPGVVGVSHIHLKIPKNWEIDKIRLWFERVKCFQFHFCPAWVTGATQTKKRKLSSFTRAHIIPKMYDFLSSLKHKSGNSAECPRMLKRSIYLDHFLYLYFKRFAKIFYAKFILSGFV